MTHPLIQKYVDWIKEETIARDVNGWVEITSPLLDRHNDLLQIYVKANGDSFELTDDSYILNDLRQSGCELTTPKRKQLLQSTLNGFGISLKNNSELHVAANASNFALKKHNLLQAMLAVNDLFYLSESITKSLFLEDVTAWLDSLEIRYVSNVKLAGNSGLDYRFDFVIPKSSSQPERIVQTMNYPSRSVAEHIAFSWIETEGMHKPGAKAYALINDSKGKISPSILKALRQYDVQPVTWSARKNIVEELAA